MKYNIVVNPGSQKEFESKLAALGVAINNRKMFDDMGIVSLELTDVEAAQVKSWSEVKVCRENEKKNAI